MSKPLLLDLFSGDGGCSKGYADAGFEVVGVDKEKRKRYPFQFIRGDALKVLGMKSFIRQFDAIHASPPCQEFSSLRHLPGYKKGSHADLIVPVRDLLVASGKPYIIENVPGAPLQNPLMLCGTMFGLRTDCGAELRRHRLFEIPWFWEWWYGSGEWFGGSLPVCSHYADSPIGVKGGHAEAGARTLRTIGVSGPGNPMTGARQQQRVISVYGDHPRDTTAEKANSKARTMTLTGHSCQTNVKPNRTISVIGKSAEIGGFMNKNKTISVTGSTPQQNVVRNMIRETFSVEQARIAMGIPWMTMQGLSLAIPPAYTKWIAERLIRYLEENR